MKRFRMLKYSDKHSLFQYIIFLKFGRIGEMIISKINMGRLFPAVSIFLMGLIAFSGCSMSNYGKLKSTPEVTRAFEAYQILPGHKYYYRGTYSQPVVIVGINKNYELNSKLWVEIDR